MASTKTRTRNRNRYGKQYPLIRRRPVNELVTEYETIIEAAMITFNNTPAITYYFEQLFPGIPSVTAIARDAGVNVFISSISKVSVTIEVSDPLVGSVHMQAMYIGS